ncbi:MAG TPA: ParB N-terminal domain-containing protein [Bacteroidia bacterium]|nr:ParB N-terminal domain-containing protein [Bacteroidia bacterium]
MSKKANKSKPEFLPEGRNDLLKVDVRAIKPTYEWNPRENYTDIEELAEDIFLNGIQVPVKGRRLKDDPDGYLYAICGGYRRHMAAMLLLEQKRLTEIRAPFILEAKGTSEIDRLAYTILENNLGKPFNMLEIANVIKRMSDHGLEDDEISARINKPAIFLKNCYSLLEAPEAAKKLIREGRISPTLCIALFKKERNFEKMMQTIEEMVANSPKERITALKVAAAQGKVNSAKIFKKMVFKTHSTALVKDDKVELYEFGKKLISGGFTSEELEEMFFITE